MWVHCSRSFSSTAKQINPANDVSETKRERRARLPFVNRRKRTNDMDHRPAQNTIGLNIAESAGVWWRDIDYHTAAYSFYRQPSFA